MTVTRKEPTAEGFARAIAAALKPGPHGTPAIIEWFGSTDGRTAGFVVTSAEPDALDTKYYRVTIESSAAEPQASESARKAARVEQSRDERAGDTRLVSESSCLGDREAPSAVEAVMWSELDEHECLYAQYSHTSYRDGVETDVLYCTFPRCPNWIYAEFPLSGRCARCLRERDDLFWHRDDRKLYCADVFRCEARYVIQSEREEQTLCGSARGAEGDPRP